MSLASHIQCKSLLQKGQKRNGWDVAFYIYIYMPTFDVVFCGKFESPYLGKAQQMQERRYPFLSACAVFWDVQTMVWLPVFGIFNVCTDVDVYDCIRWLRGHRRRVCTESGLWEKVDIPCRSGDSNPSQYCAWLFTRTL